MGLFNRKPKTLMERELIFNKQLIQANLNKCRGVIYDYKDAEGHQGLLKVLQNFTDLEMIKMTEGKDISAEAHAYSRGRIDALRDVLNFRQTIIRDMQNAKRERSPAKELTRSYFKPPTTAGIA